MNARDELRGTLCNTICNASNYTNRAQPYLLGSDMSVVLDKTADAILAAGYRKPRQITTAEELDALPAEVVVRSSVGVVWEKYADDYSDGDGTDFWQQVGLQRMYASSKVTLPATVLYEPEVS